MSTVLKINFNDDLRKITICTSEIESGPFTFAQLRARIQSDFDLPATFSISYTDGDGDVVTIANDEDLKEAVRGQSINPLRIDVILPRSDSGESIGLSASADVSPPPPERIREQTTVLKINFNDNLREITICTSEIENGASTFAQLRARIQSDFDLPATFSISYTDGDGDVVTIANDEDLKEAVRGQSINPLRIDVILPGSDSGESVGLSASAAVPPPPERIREQTTVLKINFNDNLRKITICTSEIESGAFTFAQLQARIRSDFKLPATFSISYTDGDGDVVTIANDEDLKEAVRGQSINPLRIDVILPGSDSGESVGLSASAAVPPPPERIREQTTVLKINFNDNLRKIAICTSEIESGAFTFAQLQARIRSDFKLPATFSISYTDGDGDVVTIANDTDLKEAVRGQSINPLRIDVILPGSDSGESVGLSAWVAAPRRIQEQTKSSWLGEQVLIDLQTGLQEFVGQGVKSLTMVGGQGSKQFDTMRRVEMVGEQDSKLVSRLLRTAVTRDGTRAVSQVASPSMPDTMRHAVVKVAPSVSQFPWDASQLEKAANVQVGLLSTLRRHTTNY